MSFHVPAWYRVAGSIIGRSLQFLSSPRTGPWPEATAETVWIHAASLGEAKGISGLVAALGESAPSLTLTCATRSGVDRLRSSGLDAYLVPFDESRSIGRFLSARKVRKAVFLEAEAWPSVLEALAARQIPVAFAGFRTNPTSMRRWRMFGRGFDGWTETVQMVWTDRDGSTEEVARLGFRSVRAGTPLKQAGPYPPPGPGTGPDAAVSLHLRDLSVLFRMGRERSDRGWLWFPRHPRSARLFGCWGRIAGLEPVAHAQVGPGQVYVSPRLGEVRSLLPGCRSAWVSPGHDVSEPFLCRVPDVKTGNPPALVDPPSIDPEQTIRQVLGWMV